MSARRDFLAQLGGLTLNMRRRQDHVTLRPLTVFDVRKFGKVGSGVLDDRVAIQTALDALISQGGGLLHLPARTFLFETLADGSSDRILKLHNPGREPITVGISADPGAVFTTPLHVDRAGSQVSLLSLSGPLEDCVVEGLGFANTHALTAGATSAISASGGVAHQVKRLSVLRCIFRNHSRAMHISGVEGITVFDSKFLYTRGRDSGNTTAADPNVSIWCFVDNNGQTSDVRLLGNFFDGCTTGTVVGNATPAGLDGFVTGASRGWYIAGNVIKRNGFEAIYISHRENSTADRGVRYPVLITSNGIDASPPSGSTGASTWGIRSDEQGTAVRGNSIKGAAHGILITGQGLLNVLEGVQCTDNSLDMPIAPRVSNYGVSLQAVAAPMVHDNLIQWSGEASASGQAYAVQVFQCPNAHVEKNVVQARGLPTGGSVYGFYIQQTYAARFVENAAVFCNVGVYEHQHIGGQSGNRFSRTLFTKCLTTYGGDDVSTIVIEEFIDPVSPDRWADGDRDLTLASTDVTVQRFDSPRTSDRTVTLLDFPVTAGANGRYFDLVFAGAGAFQVTVRDSTLRVLKVVPKNISAVVRVQQDNGSVWRLSGYQLL